MDFDVKTDPSTDQILSQMRQSQASSQLPPPSTIRASSFRSPPRRRWCCSLFIRRTTPMTVSSLANYAVINLNDRMTRVPGIASVTVFGSGQYAIRLWVKPDRLAQMGITVRKIIAAIQAQNTVIRPDRVGASPSPGTGEFTYAVRAQGRLETSEEFGEIVLPRRAGRVIVRVKDVARVELGAQNSPRCWRG